VQRFRGGLVFKAHRFCVSLNSRLESNNEEEEKVEGLAHSLALSLPPSTPLSLSVYVSLLVLLRLNGPAACVGTTVRIHDVGDELVLARTVLLARCAALKERCPPRPTSRVERLKVKVEPLLT